MWGWGQIFETVLMTKWFSIVCCCAILPNKVEKPKPYCTKVIENWVGIWIRCRWKGFWIDNFQLFAVAPICQTRWKTKSLLRKSNLARFQTEQASSSVVIEKVLNRYFNFFSVSLSKQQNKIVKKFSIVRIRLEDNFDSDKEQIYVFHMQILSCERNIKFCPTSSATTTTTNNA